MRGGLFSKALELLFPARCPFCRSVSDPDYLEEHGICPECGKTVFQFKEADELPHGALSCVLKLYVPFRYTGEVKKAMLRYKFGGENWLAEPFARLLYEYLRKNGATDDAELITFVPVSARRLAVRGYDQSALIAKKVGELSGLPVRSLLMRTDRKSTSELNLEERKSRKRFEIKTPGTELANMRILLIDDIFTTGSTLTECAKLLLEHGAGAVDAACMCSGRQDIYGLSGKGLTA